MRDNWTTEAENLQLLEIEFSESPQLSSSEECKNYFKEKERQINGSLSCDSVWDSVLCWPPALAGQMVSRSCRQILQYVPSLDVRSLLIPQGAKAFRICDNNGQWIWGNWTNYSECLDFATAETPNTPLAVSLILLVCSLISLLLLSLTIFIFFYFKSLQCSRLQVHRNLVIALVVHSLMLVVISLPVVGGKNVPSYRDISELCKAVVAIKMYATLSSINWMFVEGLLLHSRITTSIFQKNAPFKFYYLIGWGIPVVLIVTWCIIVDNTLSTGCWEGYGRSPSVWIITGPMIAALAINLIFLINIIRILVTKLRASAVLEIVQIRRAIKATALLFPLLGITHLLFCVNPRDDSRLEEAYMITNAVLQSSQGIFVSVLYCFLNVEVQTAVRKAYVRAALRRNPNHRYTWRSRSQNSTYFSSCDTSGTETSFRRPRSISVFPASDGRGKSYGRSAGRKTGGKMGSISSV